MKCRRCGIRISYGTECEDCFVVLAESQNHTGETISHDEYIDTLKTTDTNEHKGTVSQNPLNDTASPTNGNVGKED